MAFDVANTAHLVTLRDYGNSLGLGSTGDLLDQFNLVDNNPSPSTGPGKMTANALLLAIFDISISSQDQFKIQLLFEATEGRDGDLSEYRVLVGALGAQILAAINTIVRSLSYADATFGVVDANGTHENVVISESQWFAARDYTGS